MTTDPWSEYSTPQNGDYPEVFKWEPVGAAIVGEITVIRKTSFEGRDVPVMHITRDDGTERSVFCGLTSLLSQLIEKKPMVGDRIAIQYVKPEKTSGGYTAKIFDVEVKRADGSTVDPAPAPATSAADLL